MLGGLFIPHAAILAALLTAGPDPDAAPVKVVVGQRLPVEAGDHKFQVAYASNLPLEQPNARVDRAIIVVHGLTRDADQNLESVLQAASQTGSAVDRTIVVAPQFLSPEDVSAHNLGDDVARWRGHDWVDGDPSRTAKAPGKPAGLSSYVVVDRLIEMLAEKSMFPKLRRIVIAGHSAGGQFVNRYAAGNRMDEKVKQDRGIRVRYVVANPSTYMYFSDERPSLDSKGGFARPADEKVKDCGDYNNYRWGTEKLNPYMQAVGADNLGRQYAQREVIYLLGGEDNDPNHPSLSKTCEAMLQGRTRLERGHLYYAYLRHFFGPEIVKAQRLQVVSGVGHNSRKMFNSPPGVASLFESASQSPRRR